MAKDKKKRASGRKKRQPTRAKGDRQEHRATDKSTGQPTRKKMLVILSEAKNPCICFCFVFVFAFASAFAFKISAELQPREKFGKYKGLVAQGFTLGSLRTLLFTRHKSAPL